MEIDSFKYIRQKPNFQINPLHTDREFRQYIIQKSNSLWQQLKGLLGFLVLLNEMPHSKSSPIFTEQHLIQSVYLKREVIVDCYMPRSVEDPMKISLLLVNDGQDLVTMNFKSILESLEKNNELEPLLVVAMHCSDDRKNEYGTARILDYKGRGAKSGMHTQFVLEELMPFIQYTYRIPVFKERAIAGFSLGGLNAMDIAWNHPVLFNKVGVFSGSFWWRDKAQEDPDFDETIHRIMHRQVREADYYPWLRFFFEVGTQDETADRNNNGIIDAIDDTLALMEELKNKGYSNDAMFYLELQDGRHDVPTWARAFPDFLKWGWGIKA